MRLLTRNALALLAVLVLLPSTVLAQATLQGVVRDTSGAVLPGVTVEAASPVLIEGVRATVTGGEGRYTIVNLRPGAYTVTFALPGFATVIQEGVAVSTAGATVVDTAMQVGGLEETITVTGEAPIVDVTTATRSAVLSADTVDALPTSRNYLALGVLIPGTSDGGSRGRDVGGSQTQEVGGHLSIHGSRANDQRVMLNGVPTQTLQAGGGLGGQVPDMGTAAEVVVEHTAVSADLSVGGLRINFVPRDGGNTFSTSSFFTFTNSSMVGSNFTPELEAAGLRTPDEVDRNYDINVGIGGPIVQDKVWFWYSGRRNVAERFVGTFGNVNRFNPDALLYVEDRSVLGEEKGQVMQNSVRITWQMTPRNKIAGTQKMDRWCTCPETGNPGSESPEANEDFRFPRLTQEHLEWTSPVSNNLLLEWVGLHLFERWGNMHPHQSAGWNHSFSDIPEAIANVDRLISIQDQGLANLRYGVNNSFNNTHVPNYAWRGAATYVSGIHNLKIGINNVAGFQRQRSYSTNPVSYRFRNGVPNRISLRADPRTAQAEQNWDFGVFVQDTISLDRVTIGAALRWDTFQTSFPEQTVGPGPVVPNRNLVFPAEDNLDWQDVTYRSSVTYDLRGDGRTALKFTANRYLEGQTLNGLGGQPNPVNAMANSTNINWTDADGDLFPDCDLLNPAPNGECHGWSTTAFGSTRSPAQFDPDLLTGFNARQSNWEFSIGAQQELMTGVSVDVGYFRRIWQNLPVTDSQALNADDYDFFAITIPTDARLPGGGGQTLDGFRALKQSAFQRPPDNISTLASKLGEITEHWDGVDVNLNVRLQNGLQMQIGSSTGRTAINDCGLASQLPENNLNRAIQFCDRAEPFLTQVKGFAVYIIPTIDVQVAGTFRSQPGNFINANFRPNNAYLADNSTLGRPLAGGARNITIQLLEPNTRQLERRNHLDLRFGKVLRMGGARAVVSLDVFNALNINPPVAVNQNFGAGWLAPQSIIGSRVAKISVQLDF